MRQKNSDTSLRYIALLRCLPQHPQRISVADIRTRLASLSPEYGVTPRTIQRDLERLSQKFPLSCDTEGRTNYWFWASKDALTQIPEMGQDTALVFNLAENHLRVLLPASTLELLTPYFSHALEVLKGSPFAKWSQNIRAIPSGPVLEPPPINPDVHEAVYEALLKERRLAVAYRPRGADSDRDYVLNPLALVSRNGAMYLVATAWGYEDPRHYLLSRIHNASVQTEAAHPLPDFDLDSYIHEQGEFSYPHSDQKLALELIFKKRAGFQFTESRLAPDQQVSTLEDGRIRVTATVRDDAELRWWLRSFGDEVEVIQPDSLREEFREMAQRLYQAYENKE